MLIEVNWVYKIDKKTLDYMLSRNSVSDKALDCKKYNTIDESCTWETCTLRAWLNGTDTYFNDDSAFINVAFTETERNSIIETDVLNENNPIYNTSGGNDTKDMIYLLSLSEVTNGMYGFDILYENQSKSRETKVTDYALVNCEYITNRNSDYIENCNWWLRSPSDKTNRAANVLYDGRGYKGGDVNYNTLFVRPALHIDLSVACINVSGIVSSTSNIDLVNETSEKIEEVYSCDWSRNYIS